MARASPMKRGPILEDSPLLGTSVTGFSTNIVGAHSAKAKAKGMVLATSCQPLVGNVHRAVTPSNTLDPEVLATRKRPNLPTKDCIAC
jgi:hypothetical protein